MTTKLTSRRAHDIPKLNDESEYLNWEAAIKIKLEADSIDLEILTAIKPTLNPYTLQLKDLEDQANTELKARLGDKSPNIEQIDKKVKEYQISWTEWRRLNAIARATIFHSINPAIQLGVRTIQDAAEL